MGLSNTFVNDNLKLWLNGTPIGNIADNAAGSPLTNLFLSLHTANPGGAGTQTTSEATYTGYGRATVARTTGGWTVTGVNFANAATVAFAPCSGGSNSISHFAIGVAISGSSKILLSGALNTPLAVSSGVVPTFAAGALTGSGS